MLYGRIKNSLVLPSVYSSVSVVENRNVSARLWSSGDQFPIRLTVPITAINIANVFIKLVCNHETRKRNNPPLKPGDVSRMFHGDYLVQS